MAAGDVLNQTATSGPAAPRAGAGFRPGDQIRRYVVERTLGAGGMGVVYAAHDPDLDRRIAVKVLRGDASGESRTRLLREARAMAKVSHPNVITVYEVGSDGAIDFVAMELIEGGSLADWLKGGRRPAREVLRIFRAAGRGLAAAHACGLVHRDFKPGNVLLGPGGKVVVTDFGLARGFEAGAATATPDGAPPLTPTAVEAIALDVTLDAGDTAGVTQRSADADRAETPAQGARRARLDSADLSSTLTRTGAVLGTPAYMAPEQFAGQNVGPAADQFSFAVALWEGLTGERPFRGGTLDELRTAVAGAPEGAAELPRGLRPVLARALQRQPAQRWRDLDAMLDAIDRAEARPGRIAAGAIAAGGVLVSVAIVIGLRHGDTTAARIDRQALCALADRDLDSAWSPAIAEQLAQHFGGGPGWDKTRARLDEFATQWKAERADACSDPTARTYHGRLACLSALRDELGAGTALLATVPAEVLRGPMDELVPKPVVCRSGQRAAMAPLPEDDATRAAFSEIVRGSALARFTARSGDPTAAKRASELAQATLDRARGIAYPPALAIALEARASVAHLTGDTTLAMKLYDETATAAEAAGVDGIRAMARIGQVECAIDESSDLDEIQAYAGKAAAAIERAGKDPILQAALDTTMARVAAATGELDEAITRTAAARATFLANGDARRAATSLSAESAYRALRAEPGDEAESLALYRAALEQTVLAFGEDHPITEEVRLQLGLRLVDTAPEEGRALIRRAAARRPVPQPPADAIHIAGRVRAAGPLPADLKVYAARVLMATSDGLPLAVETTGFASAPVGADGSFDVVSVPGAMVYAAAPGWASTPRQSDPRRPTELRLERAAAITVEITTQRPTPSASAERAVQLGSHVAEFGLVAIRTERSAVYQSYARKLPEHAYTIEESPSGPSHVALIVQSALGDTTLVGFNATIEPGHDNRFALAAELRGQVLDVIVRADRAAAIPTAQIVMAPGKLARPPRTNLDLYGVISSQPRLHLANAARVVEATQTAAGKRLYQPGDIHARFAGVPVGPLTICVMPLAGDIRDSSFMKPLAGAEDLEVHCQTVEVTDQPGAQAFVVSTPPMKRRPVTTPG